MKKFIKLFLTLGIVMLLQYNVYSQPRPPAPGTSDDTIGGNAPIDGGLSIFMLLGFAYSTFKYKIVKKK